MYKSLIQKQSQTFNVFYFSNMFPFKENIKFQCHIKEIAIMPSDYYMCLGNFKYKYNRIIKGFKSQPLCCQKRKIGVPMHY